MKDFEKVNWKQYNRPPFYQQWLCKDDTLKLTTFGDDGLAELDNKLLELKDQWDLDNVTGHDLDRIGKLLAEKRNGNPDEFYRIILNLRRLLNTNDGSIPSIIKAIKYFYSSEVVHIVPDYPAGLIIEHDGEGTQGLNFNRLLAEIIPAGVGFSTKEIFIFTEEFDITDFFDFSLCSKILDNYARQGKLFYNGRILHDGKTDLGTEIKPIGYDGKYIHNSKLFYKRLYKREKSEDELIRPFVYSSGLREKHSISIDTGTFTEEYSSNLFYDGSVNYDCSENYKPEGNNHLTETMNISIMKHHFYNNKYKHDTAIMHDANKLIPLE